MSCSTMFLDSTGFTLAIFLSCKEQVLTRLLMMMFKMVIENHAQLSSLLLVVQGEG